DARVLRRLLRQSRRYSAHLFGLFFLELVSAPLALLAPLPLKIAVDSVLGTRPLPGFLREHLPSVATRSPTGILVMAALLVVLIAILQHAKALASWVLATYTGERLVLDFRSQLVR